MGFWHSKPKQNERMQDKSKTNKNQKETQEKSKTTENPENPALARIRKSLEQNMEVFLLNNILLSVQFFDNFERYVILINKYIRM